MAQTRKRRRTKHRGNAVGMIEARGRTGRPSDASETGSSGRGAARTRRQERGRRPPSWRAAINRAALSAVVLFALITLLFGKAIGTAVSLALVAFVIYVPISYYTDLFVYRRRKREDGG